MMAESPTTELQRTSSRHRTKNSRFARSPERDVAPPDVKRKRGPKDPSSFKLFSTELTTLAQIAREVADEEADNRTVAPLPRSALLVDMERSSSATTMLEVCCVPTVHIMSTQRFMRNWLKHTGPNAA